VEEGENRGGGGGEQKGVRGAVGAARDKHKTSAPRKTAARGEAAAAAAAAAVIACGDSVPAAVGLKRDGKTHCRNGVRAFAAENTE